MIWVAFLCTWAAIFLLNHQHEKLAQQVDGRESDWRFLDPLELVTEPKKKRGRPKGSKNK